MVLGKLYERLVLFTDNQKPPNYGEYYAKAKETIEEAQNELDIINRMEDNHTCQRLTLIKFTRKWFGRV